MKDVQKLLLVVGATALGICSFVLALFCYSAATGFMSHHGPSDLGAAGLGFLLFTGSATLGGIVGFIVAVWWIRKHDSRPWTGRIWSGVTLGIVTGVALHFASRSPRFPFGAIVALIVAVFVAAWWIRNHDSGPWASRIWIGMTLGLATGFAFLFASSRLIRLPTLLEYFENGPAAAVQTAALGMLGGVFATFTKSRWNRP